ncbi:MAG: ATP-binding protein [Candidatus Woesearchaeota archaeon]
MYDIILGRLEPDRKKYGTKGTILLGRQYVTMGQVTSLANNIHLDISGAHVVFICGKRGGGKSYTMGVIAEGLADLSEEIKENLSIIMLDTMGIYWTMRYANQTDDMLLRDWGFKPHALNPVIFTPKGYFHQYRKEGIPTDYPFSIRPSELTPEDWFLSFEVTENDPMGILIERTILRMKKQDFNYDIDDIIDVVQKDPKADQKTKDAVENRFLSTKEWGVFDKEGTKIKDLAVPGQVTVLDVSCYATMPGGWKIKSLVIGIVSQRLFVNRMVVRKKEEYQQIHSSVQYGTQDEKKKKGDMPLVWLVIDEAHEFLPVKGKTTATDSLVTIMREGRQPGISLILATQQPGKIHTDVMTQSDILISHRITAKLDTDALGMLMQSYMREGLDKYLNNLPREKGSALIVDDANERIYPMRVRPRFTWHGGSSPSALKKESHGYEILNIEDI